MKEATGHKTDKKTDQSSHPFRNGAPAPGPHIDHLFNIPIGFSELLDKISIGVLLLDLDRKVVFMNAPLQALTGFSRKGLCGLSCLHILRSTACLQNCPALEVNTDSGRKCIEGNLINRDRQVIPVRITTAPLKNLDGEMIGFIETVEDISLLRKLDENTGHAYTFNNIIGHSAEMEKIFHILPSLAQSDSSVLITGETGTGKDMVAEAIHQASDRARGPFVKINCGALPETLLESELFGHRKGAFTGAVENKPGRFQLAQNGTLYLTEIGDLPLSLQVKLLTFLDDREIFPLGSIKGVAADVRVIAATHRNLERRVNDRRFRKDLLFRLNVLRLHLPPLRDRQGDIQLLLDHFTDTLAAQLGRKKPALSKEARQILKGYKYPGNVRELRNIVEYAINICNGGDIEVHHLPAYLTEAGPVGNLPEEPPGAALPAAAPGAGSGKRAEAPQNWPDIEKQMIIEALVKANGRKSKAAVLLGCARSTLWRKIKQYGIQ